MAPATCWRDEGRAAMLAARVSKLVTLRKKALSERKIAIVIFNFPPNAGAVGTAAFLSVFESVRNTLHAMKAAGYSVDAPGDGGRSARGHPSRKCAIARRQRERACAHSGRSPRRQRATPRRDRSAMGPGARTSPDRRRLDLRARRAVRKRLRRHPARLRLRGRPDASSLREGLRPDPCVQRLLQLPEGRFPRRGGAAFRHARRAGVHARQAVRHGRHVLARPTDRRPAELLSLCVEQSFGRRDRQAPRSRDAHQLSHAADRARRAFIADCWI